MLIVALLENNKAHPSVLAECLAIAGITVIARIQRIRRFLSNEKLSPDITVVPLIRLMRPLLSNAREIVLDRKGNSSFKHWKRVLTPVIDGLQQTEGLSGIPIHVVADREFASPKLAEWLKKTYDVDATLRMKASISKARTKKNQVMSACHQKGKSAW